MPKSPANCSQAGGGAGRRAGRTAFAAGLNAEGGGKCSRRRDVCRTRRVRSFSPFRDYLVDCRGFRRLRLFHGVRRRRCFGGGFRPEVTSQ